MKISNLVLLIVTGLLVGAFAGSAIAASGKGKDCGGDPPTGSTKRTNNSNCPDCEGNCSYKELGGRAKKYKTCVGAGDTCENDKEDRCSGVIMTQSGCGGDVVKDSTGVLPMTCQSAKFQMCQ